MKIAILPVALLAGPALAQPAAPVRVNHHGRLLDADDHPLNGAVDLTFVISTTLGVDPNFPGETRWTATYEDVPVTNGQYSVELGGGTPLLSTVFDGAGDLFLGITVNGTEMKPRLRIGSTPYAFTAGRALSAAEADHAAEAGHAEEADRAADLACTGGPCVGAGDIEAGAVGDDAVSSLSGSKIAAGTLGWDRLQALSAPLRIGNLEADRLDGRDAADFAASSHGHALSEITGGTVPESQLPMTALDARWVNASGDTVTGALAVEGALSAQAGLSVTGNISASGTVTVRPSAAAPAACSGAAAGQVFYDGTDNTFFTCIGSQPWRLQARAMVGDAQGRPGLSCKDILDKGGSVGNGLYWVGAPGSATQVYCDMTTAGGGWTRIADVDPTTGACPGEWAKLTSPPVCWRNNANSSGACKSATFNPGVSYTEIRGYVRAYQYYSMDGFHMYNPFSIDGPYVDGVSITRGSPREHIWSYAVGISDEGNYPDYNCPCAVTPGAGPPSFVGANYHCESGNLGSWEQVWYTMDPLYDGLGCQQGDNCCANPNLPWFQRSLGGAATTPIEVRLCSDQESAANEDVGVYRMELYVR